LALVAAANCGVYGLATRLGRYWPNYLLGARPTGIVIHHSATAPGDDSIRTRDGIDHGHAQRGWGLFFGGRVYHIGYHYLIDPDGRILQGRPEWLPGAHVEGHNDTLGLCLLGDFSRDSSSRLRGPSRAQMDSLVRLVKKLMARYHLSHKQVYLHSDLRPTQCPGAGFPRDEFYRDLGAQ